MGFNRVPCPELYLSHRKSKPLVFVDYCQGFIEKCDPGMKAIGVETSQDGQVYILTMPNYDAKRPIIKGKGKTKTVTYEQMYKCPIESFLNEDDIEYLKKKGMDKFGNKT